MSRIYHLPGSYRVIELGIYGSPFFRSVTDEHDIVGGFITGILHGLSNAQRQSYGTAVILEAVEIHIVMSRKYDLLVGRRSLYLPDYIVADASVRHHFIVYSQSSRGIPRLYGFLYFLVLVPAYADARHQILGTEILHIYHVVRIGAVSAFVAVGHYRGGALYIRFIYI